MRNCVPCHLPNADGQIDPSLAIIFIGLQCMLCGQSIKVAIMLVCGMFDIALGPCTGWQMVLPSMHLIDVVPKIT